MNELNENWLSYLVQGGILLIVWELARQPFRRALLCAWDLLKNAIRAFRRRVVYPLKVRAARHRHGYRISNLIVNTNDEYMALTEEDQKLLLMLEPNTVLPLLLTREKFDWEVEAEEKAEKAVATQRVFTRQGEQLQCWNCAFFVVGFDDKNGSFRRNTLKGHCYSELPSRETYLESFCRHHSATKGYLKSQAGRYNIAPVDS